MPSLSTIRLTPREVDVLLSVLNAEQDTECPEQSRLRQKLDDAKTDDLWEALRG